MSGQMSGQAKSYGGVIVIGVVGWLASCAVGSTLEEGDENDDGASGLPPQPDVLGAAASDAEERPFLAIAVLTIVGALLLAMLALVTRFLRGSWNP